MRGVTWSAKTSSTAGHVFVLDTNGSLQHTPPHTWQLSSSSPRARSSRSAVLGPPPWPSPRLAPCRPRQRRRWQSGVQERNVLKETESNWTELNRIECTYQASRHGDRHIEATQRRERGEQSGGVSSVRVMPSLLDPALQRCDQ